MKNDSQMLVVDNAEKTELKVHKEDKQPKNIVYPNLKFLVAGILFGFLLIKGEVISWFRIQEMFRLQSFHMFGIIGSAITVGMASIWLIKKFGLKTVNGEKISIPAKKFNKGLIYGGLLFGFGWAITGACPGPLFAQIGSGATVVVVTLL